MRKLTGSAVIAATLAGLACSDPVTGPGSAFKPASVPRRSLASDPKVSFEMTGFTYGPTWQEITPPSCAKRYAVQGEAVDWYVDGGGYITLQFTLNYNQSCGIDSDPGGATYVGGRINATGFGEGSSIALGGVDADWSTSKTVSDYPASAMVQFEAIPAASASCSAPVFLDWIINNDWGHPRYENPLVLTGSQLGVVSGEFKCSSRTGTNPSPPPPPPPPCDEPSDPSCNPPHQ